MSSENLDIPDLTEGQDGKITSINAAFNVCDKAITNRATLALSGATYDMSATETVQNKGYICTGALAALCTVYLDENEKFFWMRDATTGGHEVRIRVTGDVGSYVALPKGSNEYACLYSDGTDVIKIQVSGAAPGADEAAYIDVTLAADQTASIGDGDQVAFDTVNVSNVISNSSGVFTLPGGSRDFLLMAQVVAEFSTSSGYVTLQWYDIDGAAYVGKEIYLEPETGADKSGTGTMVTLFSGPSGTRDVELRIKGAPSNLFAIESEGTKVVVQQVSSVSSVVGITEVITAHVAALAENDVIVLDEYAMYDYDVELVRIKLNTGTLDANFKIGVTSITGLSAVAVTSSQSQATASAANSVTVGDRLTVTLTNLASSPDHLTFTLKITRQS